MVEVMEEYITLWDHTAYTLVFRRGSEFEPLKKLAVSAAVTRYHESVHVRYDLTDFFLHTFDPSIVFAVGIHPPASGYNSTYDSSTGGNIVDKVRSVSWGVSKM